MSSSESALGTERGSFGVWMAAMLALWAKPRLSRKRKKERTEEKARAVEVRAMPSRARSASHARNSAGFSFASASSVGGAPRYVVMKPRNEATSCS